jgi:hypothetical protein
MLPAPVVAPVAGAPESGRQVSIRGGHDGLNQGQRLDVAALNQGIGDNERDDAATVPNLAASECKDKIPLSIILVTMIP